MNKNKHDQDFTEANTSGLPNYEMKLTNTERNYYRTNSQQNATEGPKGMLTKRRRRDDDTNETPDMHIPLRHKISTTPEKQFLLAVERGDLPLVRKLLREHKNNLNINCCDPLGRSGLLMAIDNENLEMIKFLIYSGIQMEDALLHAISEEFVEAVELLLDHEDQIHTPGNLNSWEAVERDTFTTDITPLVLASHRNNYEIIKILIDRNISPIPRPHDARCGCKECRTASKQDSLRHSRSRINAYKALSSPSLIALSSKDPFLTAFELSWQLRRLSFLEPEFKNDYLELRKQCQTFATALLDHTRTTEELDILLNYDPNGDPLEGRDRMQLSRLKLAIRVKQKMFCANANVQQLLAAIWYEGLPGFRRKNMVLQTLQLILIGVLFPLLSVAYILAPHSTLGTFIKKPFIKFICHSASYVTFLVLLMLASQRVENDVFDSTTATQTIRSGLSKRGKLPSFIELCILSWVFGLIWSEIKQLWDRGISEYLSDMWNILDFINNSLYVATITLRVIAYIQTQKEKGLNLKSYVDQRDKWDDYDPILLSEGLFATANIFSSLKLVYIFSVNPYLGPLQISLGRMVIDILKFFFFYLLVLFSFACGMNQLLWYYAQLERDNCNNQLHRISLNETMCVNSDSCIIWRRFANLFESSQTLFWATYGLIDLNNFELHSLKSYTKFWAMLMFGVYSIINVTVLINLLIAMMNHSYQLISEQSDIEWKFARSKLWISYFGEGATVPPPFNVIPTPKTLSYLIRWLHQIFCGLTTKAKTVAIRTIRLKQKKANERDYRYQTVMRALIKRYIMNEQRIQERQRGVTEDDCNEIKQDVSSLRYELLEMLGGRKDVTGSNSNSMHFGKKSRQRERRLMKGFNFDFLAMDQMTSCDEDAVNLEESEKRILKSLALKERALRVNQGSSSKRNKGTKWRQLIEATRNKVMPFSRSQESNESDTLGCATETNSNFTGDSVSIKQLDVNLKRKIFARKLDSLNLSKVSMSLIDTTSTTPKPSKANTPILVENKENDKTSEIDF